MADRVLTASIIAREAVMVLENNLVAAKNVYRGHEDDFKDKVNGYKIGDSVDITRPAKFTVRSGATASAQDVVEGKFTMTVDQQKGVDFDFTSKQLSLDIDKLSERVIQPAMTAIMNEIDKDVLSMVKEVPNWVGTPGQTINSFSDLSKGPERLDEFGVGPNRNGFLAPADSWGLINSIGGTSGPLQSEAQKAYKDGLLTRVAATDLYAAQNVYRHTVGAHGGTPLVNGASQNVAYSAAQDSDEQSLITDGWTNDITGILKAGDIITIAGVNAVNSVTGEDLGFLRQFVVKADADSGATTGPATLTISPAIITSGAFKTCSAAPADNAAITVLGTASTTYPQSTILTPDAFSLAMVPMVMPAAVKGGARATRNGISVRILPTYNGTSDVSSWRLDVLYGKKVIDAHKACRISGTA